MPLNRHENILDKNVKYILVLLTPFVILFATIFPIVFFLGTFYLAWKIVRPMLVDKILYLKVFYSEGSEKSSHKLTVKDHTIIMASLLGISGGTFPLSCALSSSFTIILMLCCLGLFCLSFLLLKIKIRKTDVLTNKKLLRSFYFKDTLIVGVIFSFVSVVFDSGEIFKHVKGTLGLDLCSAMQLINNVIDVITSIFPAPLSFILSIFLNINIVTGFVFTLYTLFIIKETSRLKNVLKHHS